MGQEGRVEPFPPASMGAARASADVWDALDIVDEEPERAALLVVGAVEWAEEARRPEELPANAMVRIALSLFVQRHPELAGPPYARWGELLHENHALLKDIDPELRWLMSATDDLSSLWDKLPKPMMAALSRALLAGEPELATAPLYELSTMFPGQWVDWREHLVKPPALQEVFGFVLDRPEFIDEFDPQAGRPGLMTTMLTSAIMLVGFFVLLDRCTSTDDGPSAPKPRPQLTNLDSAVVAVCAEDDSLCASAREVRAHFEAQECEDAVRAARALVRQVEPRSGEERRLFAAARFVEDDVRARCPLPPRD